MQREKSHLLVLDFLVDFVLKKQDRRIIIEEKK
ncbi:hypothetical protein IUSA1_04320 [Streptococcus iniae IUSA1]|nr:hypothetical protein IUSA1_04320 [Streptococcus iniae IUSA1]